MSKLFVFFWMLFMHVFDDYFLQSAWLANGKQRSWWKKNAPDHKYRYDYVAALIAHATSWAFCIMLPTAAYWNFNPPYPFRFGLMFVWNLVLHAWIDNTKANMHKINLVTDQFLHLVQITFTFITMVLGGVS